MNKLIDADALIQNLSVDPGECPGCPEPEFLNDLIEILKAAPVIDAVPVRHGKWIRVYSRPGVFKYLGWTCDQCGYRNGNEYAPQWHKFCPGCGARMDGEQE